MRAAVAGMRLDDLALPLRIEQIGIAFRRVLWFYQIGVIADDFDPAARGRIHSIGIDLIRREMLRDIVGEVRREPAPSLPVKIMRGVGAVGDVDRVDAASLLLGDTLEYPLSTRAFDADGYSGIFGFECLAQPFGHVELQRGIIGDLALLARGFDQCWRHAGRRRRGSPDRFGEQHSGGNRGRGFQHLAPGPFSVSHSVSLALRALSQRD
jgi:hypothetical protein